MASPCTTGEGWLSQIAMMHGRVVLSSQGSLEETSSDNNPLHHRWVLNRMPLGDKALQTRREASFIRKGLKYGLYCTNRQVIGEQLQLQFTLWYPLQLCFNSIFMGWEGKGTAGNQLCLSGRFLLFYFLEMKCFQLLSKSYCQFRSGPTFRYKAMKVFC